jgi:CRISPR-associated protein Cas2
MRLYLVCYDIEDDAVRTRVAKVLLQYGERVQKSVFELALRQEGELEAIKTELLELQVEPLDIRFYPLCARCRAQSVTLSGERAALVPAYVIL